MDKTAQLIVAVVIVAFVIERITSAGYVFHRRESQDSGRPRKVGRHVPSPRCLRASPS